MTGQPTTPAVDDPPDRPQPDGTADTAELVLEDRFSMVPEWVLDADIGDCALRLYAVLLRYGNTTGARMPSRTTLAWRLHKKSVDTVDRALAELVNRGAVQIEHRWAGHQRLTNRYRIRTSRPGSQGSPQRPGSWSHPGVAAQMRLPPPTPVRIAASVRLPVSTGPGVAALIGAGWPHEPGMTENLLPRHHHPLPPTATRPDSPAGGGGGSQSRRPPERTGDRTRRGGSPEHWQRRHQTLLAECASQSPRTGTTTSPRCIRPARPPANFPLAGQLRTC